MTRQRVLLFALIVILVGGAAALLLKNPRAGATPADSASDSVAQANASQLTTSNPSSRTRDAVRDASMERVEVRTGHETDPELTAALAGFKGRVVTHDAHPAPGLVVQLLHFEMGSVMNDDLSFATDEKIKEPQIDAGECTTDAEGRFQITSVPPSALYLLIAGVGGEATTHRVVEQTPAPGEVVDLGDIELKHCAILTGKVVGAGGDPVAGALVRTLDVPGQTASFLPIERFVPEDAILFRDHDKGLVIELPEWARKRFAQLPIPSTRTDAEGKFRLGSVEPGSNLFGVTAKGLLTHVNPALRVKAGETKDLGTIKLREGESAFGKVVDARGKAVAGAEVLIAPKSLAVPMHFAVRAGPTDAEGKFQVAGLPPGSVLAAARRGAREAWTVTGEQPISNDVVITLPATHALTLRYLSKTSRELLVGAKPRLYRAELEQPSAILAHYGIGAAVDLTKRTTKLEDGRVRIDGLDAGPYQIVSTCAGHALSIEQVAIAGEMEKTIDLAEEQTLTAIVVDSAGKPVRSARVHALWDAMPGFDLPTAVGTTDRDGKVIVKHPAGLTKLTIMAQHPRYGIAEAKPPLPASEVRIVLVAPGRLTGVVTENGRPPELGKWTIVAARKDHADAPTMPRFTVPDREGKFAFQALPPDGWTLTPLKSLKNMRSFGSVYSLFFRMAMGGEQPVEVEVQIRSGETTEARIETTPAKTEPTGPCARISGTVMVDDRPAEGLVVSGYQERRHMATVDARGSFDLGLIPVGEIHLALTDPSGELDSLEAFGMSSLWSRSITIKADEPQTLEIVVRTGSMQGLVRDLEGKPAPGVSLQAVGRRLVDGKPSDDSIALSQVTDASGKFSIKRAPAGTYSLTAMHHQLGKGRVEGIVVNESVPTLGVEISLKKVVKVKGRVEMADAKKPEWIWLTLKHADQVGDEAHAGASAQADGSFEIEGVLPGTYQVELWISLGEDAKEYRQDAKLVVPDRDLVDVVIRPVLKGDK